MNDLLDHDTLGERIALALERRTTGEMSVDLGGVRTGARHRHARRNLTAAFAAVALVAGGVVALAHLRTDKRMVAQTPPTAAAPAIPAMAVLSEAGEPEQIHADAGGQPRNWPQPAVDVWSDGTTRIVVRTFPATEEVPPPEVTVAAPTTVAAPAVNQATAGTIERLADDQWVRYLSANLEGGDSVVVRGADQDSAERIFDSMVADDGVLAPPPTFTKLAHLDAMPASTPTTWEVTLGYSIESSGAGTWVSAFAAERPPTDADAGLDLELDANTRWSVGAIRTVAGVTVLDRPYYGGAGTSLVWRDPSGVLIAVSSPVALDDSIIGRISVVRPGNVEALAAELSTRLAERAELATASVDGLNLALRQGTVGGPVACVGGAGGEQCAPSTANGSGPRAGSMDAIVDGQWVIFGFAELSDGLRAADLADDRYVLADGTVLPVTVGEHDGYAWSVVRVPAGVNLLTVDASNDISGIAGVVSRPLVAGPLG